MKICAAVIIVSYAIISFLFRYEDIVSFTTWSVNFWDLLFDGRLEDFYIYSMENIRQAPHGVFSGSYLTIFPWILWNFPLWLTHRISDGGGYTRVDSMPCILWSKLLLLLCVAGAAFYVYRIVKDVMKAGEERAWLAAILAVGGYEMVNCVAYAGQDEVIYVTGILAALYYLLLGKKRTFLACSCIAVTICPIMLVPFLTAWLIYEKNIFKILGGTAMVLMPSVLFEIAYRNVEIYQQTKGNNSTDIFLIMMESHLAGTALGSVSLVGVAFVGLFFFSYIAGQKEQENPAFLVYMVAISFFIICFLAPFNVFYRFGIYAPIWAVLLVLYEDRIDMNLFLITIISYGRAFISLGYSLNPNVILTQNWNSKFLMPEILSGLEGKIDMRATVEMAAHIIGKYYFNYLLMIRTVVFAAAVLLLMMNGRGWKKKVTVSVPYKVSLGVYLCSSALLLAAFVICIIP